MNVGIPWSNLYIVWTREEVKCYYLILRDPAAGLCDTCRNVRLITSDRGSVFYLCKLAATDERFPKYPRLPVVECEGYQEKTQDDEQSVG